jgi:hypothetical protein
MSRLRNSAAEQVTVLTSGAALLKSPAQHFIDTFTAACGAPYYTLTPQAAQKILNDAVAEGTSARLVRPFTASNDLLNDQSAAPTAP